MPFAKKQRAKKELREALQGASPPTFPALTLRILQKLREPDFEFDDLAEAVERDAGLSVRLLGTVNSAAFAPQREILDVRHAIGYLGASQLESLVLAVAATVAVQAEPARGFEPARFWHTAARRASLARTIANRLHPATAAEAFTSALLLDIAIPVMLQGFGEKYSDVLEEWHSTPSSDLAKIEQARIGRTHAEIGGLVAASWDLPSKFTETIEQHHEPSGGSLSLVTGFREVESEADRDALVERARTEYGIDEESMLELIEESENAASELGRLLAGG